MAGVVGTRGDLDTLKFVLRLGEVLDLNQMRGGKQKGQKRGGMMSGGDREGGSWHWYWRGSQVDCGCIVDTDR